MNRRIFVIGLFCSMLSFAHAEPKAYELVKYRGKAAGVIVAFDFAAGYPEASEARIIDPSTHKTIPFRMDRALDTMDFVPAKAGGAIKSISLKITMEDDPPARIAGKLVTGGKTVSFTVTQSK